MLKINKAPKVKDESLIPSGMYCHGHIVYTKKGTQGICPYWDYDDEKPRQENGYCHFLGWGDWAPIAGNGNTGPAFTLLWDQCKECGIKFSFPGEENENNRR